jgi:hypothetical protein
LRPKHDLIPNNERTLRQNGSIAPAEPDIFLGDLPLKPAKAYRENFKECECQMIVPISSIGAFTLIIER